MSLEHTVQRRSGVFVLVGNSPYEPWSSCGCTAVVCTVTFFVQQLKQPFICLWIYIRILDVKVVQKVKKSRKGEEYYFFAILTCYIGSALLSRGH